MSIVKRNNDPWNTPSLFNDFFNRDLWGWDMRNNSLTNTSIPAVNIRETADSFEVEVAAPGMRKEDFRVELDNNVLTISSEHEDSSDEKENERYARREFSYQSFQRTFHLSKDVVDADKIQAKYENGLLRLMIPKKEEAKQRPPKTIHIS